MFATDWEVRDGICLIQRFLGPFILLSLLLGKERGLEASTHILNRHTDRCVLLVWLLLNV